MTSPEFDPVLEVTTNKSNPAGIVSGLGEIVTQAEVVEGGFISPLDRYNQEQVNPYRETVAGLSQPPETDEAQAMRHVAYLGLARALSETLHTRLSDSTDLLEGFSATVQGILGMCTESGVEPLSVQVDTRGVVGARYRLEDAIIVPNEGRALIDSFGLADGEPQTAATQSRRLGVRDQVVLRRKRAALSKLRHHLMTGGYIEGPGTTVETGTEEG